MTGVFSVLTGIAHLLFPHRKHFVTAHPVKKHVMSMMGICSPMLSFRSIKPTATMTMTVLPGYGKHICKCCLMSVELIKCLHALFKMTQKAD